MNHIEMTITCNECGASEEKCAASRKDKTCKLFSEQTLKYNDNKANL